MDIVEHVEGLVLGTESSGGSSDIKDLNEALRALLASNVTFTDQSESVTLIDDALEGVEGVDYSETASLWSEIIDQSRTVQVEVKSPHSSVTTRLYNHLHSVSEGDEALYNSILSEVRQCLRTSKVSDEHISSSLVEMLGFDQLDLVADLVRDKEQVCRELSTEVSRCSCWSLSI